MGYYEIEYVERVRDLAGKLNCYVNEKSTERLLTAYMLEEDSLRKSDLRNEIETLLGAYTPLLFSDKPMLRSPTPEESKGEVIIGKVTQGFRKLHFFSLYLDDFTRHIGIYGQTGHGKTSLLYSLIDQLIEFKIPFLYFDLKRDGRCLLRQQENLIVIPWKQLLRWNPLRNPLGMDVELWWRLFAEVCGHVWGVYHAGVNYLLEYLDRLHEKYKKGGRFPNLHDLYKMIVEVEEKSRKRLDYFDVMYNRIRTLTSVLKPVINVETGFRLEDMLNYPIILEIDQLRTDEQTFIVELMMTWIYAYRLVQGHRTEKLRHCIIVDEGHRIFDVNKEFRETTREMGRPPIDVFPTQFRDFGEGLIVTSQEPSQVTNSLHANTLVKISGNLGSGRDIAAISEAMNLTEEETSCIPKLQRGEWIVKLSDRYTRPFIISTPYHPVDKDVSDEEVIARAKPFLSRFEAIAGSKQTDSATLSDDAHALLLNVNRYPLMHLTNRYKHLGMVGKRGENAKSELIQKKLVEEHEIPIGNFRPVKYLVPTASGLEFLNEEGQKTGHWKGVGHVGFAHMLYQNLIRFYLSKLNFSTTLEKDLGNGRRVDVFAVIDDKRVGIEIAQNPNVDVWQLLKAQQNLDELIIVCKNRSVLEKLEERIREVAYPSVLSKLRFYLTTKYLSKLRSNVRVYKPAKKSNYSKNPDSGLVHDKKAEKKENS